MKNIEISIIYVYYNTPEEISQSIKSLKASLGNLSYEIIIVDNNSEIFLPEFIIKNKDIKVIENAKNIGYGSAVNLAVSKAAGKFLMILNSDTICSNKSIYNLYQKLKHDKSIGLIAPSIISENGDRIDSKNQFPTPNSILIENTFLRKFIFFRKFSDKFHLRNLSYIQTSSVPVVCGAAFMIRKEDFQKVNGFDENFFLYFEEDDLCERIRRTGKKVIYNPTEKIIHHIGRSSGNSSFVRFQFEKSRKYFLKKYYGVTAQNIVELLILILKKESIFVLFIVLLSAFLNTYKLSSQMMFFGDFGHDFDLAKQMLLEKKIPLVGIASSIPWLHQGPLSIYFIAAAFYFGEFNPSSPALLYGFFGAISTFLVYLIGKRLFGSKIGLLSSIFYATSPLVIVSTRMPYHTSPIPLFLCIFIYLLVDLLNHGKRRFFLLSFVLGLLIQLELANVIVIFIFAVVLRINKIVVSKKDKINTLFGFVLGILPFIVYDTSNGFRQTFLFPLWILNRIRLFLGVGVEESSNVVGVENFIYVSQKIVDQFSRLIFPLSNDFANLVILGSILFLVNIFIKKKITRDIYFITLLISIPILSFYVHGNPGFAYFPLIFVPSSIFLGYLISYFFKNKIIIACFVFLFMINGVYTVKNNYFLDSENFSGSNAIGWNYGLGISLSEQIKVADFIVIDSQGYPIKIIGEGFLKEFATSIDNYNYLVWWRGGKISNESDIIYKLYIPSDKIPEKEKIILRKSFIVIVKNE